MVRPTQGSRSCGRSSLTQNDNPASFYLVSPVSFYLVCPVSFYYLSILRDLQEAENKEESSGKSEAVGGVVKVEGEVPAMKLFHFIQG